LPKRLSLVRILAYCRKATIQKLGPWSCSLPKPTLLRFQAKIAETFEPCSNLGLLPKSHDSKARPLKLQLAKTNLT
jgi:hypothetical protein